MPLRPEIAEEVCRRLAEGETLRGICRDEHMPSEAYVRKVAREEPESFGAQYAHARDVGLECRADELMDVSNDPNIPHEHKRIMVDTRKWYLGKLAPKRYGDKIAVENSGETTVNHVHEVSPEAAALISALLNGLRDDA